MGEACTKPNQLDVINMPPMGEYSLERLHLFRNDLWEFTLRMLRIKVIPGRFYPSELPAGKPT